MKHINSFNGAVTSLLTKMGLDSGKVLAACNAWRGSVRAQETETKSEVKLAGKVNKDGEDKRTLNLSDRTKETAKKLSYLAPGALIALSDELTRLTDKHGASVTLESFPPEVEDWLNRDTFKPDQKPAPAKQEASATK